MKKDAQTYGWGTLINNVSVGGSLKSILDDNAIRRHTSGIFFDSLMKIQLMLFLMVSELVPGTCFDINPAPAAAHAHKEIFYKRTL